MLAMHGSPIQLQVILSYPLSFLICMHSKYEGLLTEPGRR